VFLCFVEDVSVQFVVCPPPGTKAPGFEGEGNGITVTIFLWETIYSWLKSATHFKPWIDASNIWSCLTNRALCSLGCFKAEITGIQDSQEAGIFYRRCSSRCWSEPDDAMMMMLTVVMMMMMTMDDDNDRRF